MTIRPQSQNVSQCIGVKGSGRCRSHAIPARISASAVTATLRPATVPPASRPAAPPSSYRHVTAPPLVTSRHRRVTCYRGTYFLFMRFDYTIPAKDRAVYVEYLMFFKNEAYSNVEWCWLQTLNRIQFKINAEGFYFSVKVSGTSETKVIKNPRFWIASFPCCASN